MASASSDTTPSGSEGSTFTLQLISPSVAVPRGLSFPELPVKTTVRQLKEKIRDTLDAKPADSAQRLIHRGRLLARDEETMLEIFGEDMIRSSEPVTLHLVLRDLADARPASTSVPTTTTQAPAPSHNQPSSAPPTQQQQHHPNQRHHIPHGPFPHPPQLPPGAHFPNFPFGVPQPQVMGAVNGAPPNMHFGFNPHQIAQQQRQWAASMADPHRLQEMINQTQRERAAMGLNGAQDAQGNPRPTPGSNTPGRTASPFQPDGTRTVVREGLGPNGQQWRITVNETVSTPQNFQRSTRTGSPFAAPDVQNIWRPPTGAAPPRSVPPAGMNGGQLSGAEVQNLIRTADAGSVASRVMADAMRRNTSEPSLVNLANNAANQPIPPVRVTTPLAPSRSGSAMGNPDRSRSVPRSSSQSRNLPQQQQQPSPGGPEVYILSSPEGPRALLINGNSGTYFTPQIPQASFPNPAVRHQFQFQQFLPYGMQPGVNMPNLQHRQVQGQFRPPQGGIWAPTPGDNLVNQNQPQPQPQGQAAPAQGLPPLPHIQHQPHHAIARPGNVQVRAIAVAQIWPHIWLIIRLGLFVWWFTTGNDSWQRWFTVMAIAFAVFIINTGLLNPMAEQIWVPIRRHLENIMPLADNHGRQRPDAAANDQAPNGQPADQRERREPTTPADTAARLIHERQNARANWLMNQARRLERAGLLFLASIAPGVAERHIAHLEAEARAERQRREAAEAEAEAARAAAENAENSENAQNSGNTEGTRAEQTATEGHGRDGEGRDERGPQRAEEPLIAI
ncbi:hypothetical protein JX265_008553 [Neoarthrinium moseri]|uniref:Ubiquitin-like domain-containing protein n=1 Tax=Neoarthrinium moseri TaxID=1658444 RepID=A0A9Q0ANC4_9PEZI|nr:hypothetical protein JX265_008553 [Neoarthrinium moseri]